MSVYSGTLTRRSVHPASPVLLTKNGPLSTLIRDPAQLSSTDLLTHLKFENRLRQLLPQGL